MLASFNVTGGADVLQLVEQTLIDVLGGLKNGDAKNLSNSINAIGKVRGRLKGELLTLQTCK